MAVKLDFRLMSDDLNFFITSVALKSLLVISLLLLLQIAITIHI